ncbi:glycine N-acyltransferase-like protein 3 isoform X1, partial [Arapaima gigas]
KLDIMKILNPHQLQQAEEVLRSYLPKSSKVYGFLFGMNRNKPRLMEVIVDSWPDFKIIILRPDPKNKHPLDNKVTFFSTDDQILKSMLLDDRGLFWNKNITIGGVNVCYELMLREISASKGLALKSFSSDHLMTLTDPSHLPHLEVSRDIESRISCLDESHIGLVNATWKFGGNEWGFRKIKHSIQNFHSCCIVDEKGQPVSWVVLYDYCAMGMLYTLPGHRQKGYAKLVISTLSRKLHSQGYPVYCFIEKENEDSYRLFSSLGFTEDPAYRAAWFKFSPST